MLHRRHHLFALGHIGDKHRCLAPDGRDFAGHGGEFGAIDVHQGDIGALLSQAQGNGPADALPGAGDQRNFSSDTHDDLLHE